VQILEAAGQKQLTQRERFEKVRTLVHPSSESASQALAAEVATLIRERAAAGQTTVLGLATGSTPVPYYRELIRLHREEGLSFESVTTFNLDEYYGLPRDHPESYFRFMRDQLVRPRRPRSLAHPPPGRDGADGGGLRPLPRLRAPHHRGGRPGSCRSSGSGGRVTSASTSPARRPTRSPG
jgi:hypothetical protein